MPSRAAVSEPSTAAGYRLITPFSQTPLRTVAPTVRGRLTLAANTVSPLVSTLGILSDR